MLVLSTAYPLVVCARFVVSALPSFVNLFFNFALCSTSMCDEYIFVG
jgi:hypothetical protein